jgi:hypothetical protein
MINTVEKIYDVLNQSNTYKVTYDNGIISFVPNNSANKDYQAIQKWIAEGGEVIDNPPTQENI